MSHKINQNENDEIETLGDTLVGEKKKKKPKHEHLDVENGCYWWSEGKKNFRISNFLIEGKYLLKNSTPELSKRIVKISNEDGEETISLAVKNMVNLNQFCAEVEGRGNFILDADR